MRPFRVLAFLAPPLAFGLALAVAPLPRRERPESTVVLDRNGRWLAAFVGSDGRWRFPVERERLPPRLIDGLLAFEDRRFRLHPGVDPFALARAAIQNLFAGEVVSGGSTLTMQVARMIEPRPRTLRSKAIELFRALQLSLHYDKDEILALYFELAPYGGNIEGIEAAAQLYYGKPPCDLSLDEIATLIALPNAPERLRPDRGGAGELRARRDDVLVRMEEADLISAEELARSSALPIHAQRRAPPQLAAQLAEQYRGRGRVQTTIDADLQQLATDHLRHRIERPEFGSGGVVIIENDTRSVRAQVGFARSLRSPGSTLKPFAYALGFDRGVIGMRTLLEDVPRDYRGWTPSNFDGRWRGLVSVQDALMESLNVPAVEVVRSIGERSLIDLLAHAGFRTFDGRRDYGLSVVLGGCEVELLELTNLYATLASGGRHARPRFLEGEPAEIEAAAPLFSEEAAFLVTEILRAAPRANSTRTLAFKTGTSYGRRDAWSVGYDPRFTVGVWLGNLDGRGTPELVGIEAAAPLLFAIVGALPSSPWFARPPGIVEREVCSLSGEAPLAGVCPHVIPTLAALQVPMRTCSHHVALAIDRESGVFRCERCRIGNRTRREVHRVFPPRVQAWLTARGEPPAPLPPHDPACTARADGDPPAIEEPKDGDVYRLRSGASARSQRIALMASASGQLWWFLDGELVERAPPGRAVLIDPVAGPHQLAAVDEEGRTAQARFTVVPAH